MNFALKTDTLADDYYILYTRTNSTYAIINLATIVSSSAQIVIANVFKISDTALIGATKIRLCGKLMSTDLVFNVLHAFSILAKLCSIDAYQL